MSGSYLRDATTRSQFGRVADADLYDVAVLDLSVETGDKAASLEANFEASCRESELVAELVYPRVEAVCTSIRSGILDRLLGEIFKIAVEPEKGKDVDGESRKYHYRKSRDECPDVCHFAAFRSPAAHFFAFFHWKLFFHPKITPNDCTISVPITTR